jgi:hypothetical protein
MTDPIRLAAEARAVIAPLHGRGDVVVRFKTNASSFKEDRLDADDEVPGHFKPDSIVLSLNLDQLVTAGKSMPRSLATIEDFRQYPVLAGVAAHESAHAKFSLWGTKLGDPWPTELPNPDFDPANPVLTKTRQAFRPLLNADGDEIGTEEYEETYEEAVPEFFPVSETGRLNEVAEMLEEPRVERLGTSHFSKTWRKAMQFSAGHFVLERIDTDDENEEEPLDAAMNIAITVGGRLTAGTLGSTYESRATVKKVLDSAQKIIETSLKGNPNAHPDPYHAVMGIVTKSVFSNDHESAVPHLEAARQILEIIHPEQKNDPDAGDQSGEGEGEGGGAGSNPFAGMTEEEQAELRDALRDMADAMKENVDALSDEMKEMVRSEENDPGGKENTKSSGHGSVLYKNPLAPQIARQEQPNDKDRELYKRARDWMERQITPTITETEQNQWLPGGGARLDVRSYLRDNMAGHRATQRSDWSKLTEAVKPAPPVKVAIMLDGSGSMGSFARASASIAWAAANAAADLPESRTVSVVYGNAAAVTQEPGHLPAKTINISNTDGGTEEFIDAAQLVEDALWLNDPVEEGQPSNVLIIVVSDLSYGGYNDRTGESQAQGFGRITKEWAERGYQIMVVGANPRRGIWNGETNVTADQYKQIELVKPEDLFKV